MKLFTLINFTIISIISFHGCKASTGAPEIDAALDSNDQDASINSDPIDVGWYRFENNGSVRELALVRGTTLFRFDFTANAGTGEWLEPLDLQENWGVANAPFETSAASLDVAWYRYDDTQGEPTIRKLNVMRNSTLHVYDYTTNTWTTSDLSTDTAANTGWASALGPFASNNTAPLDAAWYRYEGGDANTRRLSVVRGTKQFTFDFATGQWSSPQNLTDEDNPWTQTDAPFNSGTFPIDVTWFRYEGTGANKIRLLGVLRGTTQYTYNFLENTWNPVITHTTGSWTEANGPFAP